MNHQLKCRADYYEAVRTGKKTFEIRKNDRNYKVGDTLTLRPWDGKHFGIGYIRCEVAYILFGGPVGFPPLQSGYVAMGIHNVTATPLVGG